MTMSAFQRCASCVPAAAAKRLDGDAAADQLLALGGRTRLLNLDIERHLRALADDADAHGFVLSLRTHLLAQLVNGAHALAVDLDDNVAGLQPRLFGGRAGRDVAHQHTFAVRCAKVGAKLTAQVLGVDAEPRPVLQEDVVSKQFAAELRHFKLELLGPKAMALEFVGKGAQFNRDALRAAVAPEGQLHRAPPRGLADQSAELERAFDALAVELGDDIVGFETSLGDRKSTRLNSSHGYISYAVFCLKKKK